jgi:hypothetical protein
MFKMLMMTVMSSIFADKNNQEALFTDGGVGRDLEWCIVRPGGLTVEKPTGVINVIEGEAGSIARADVADFCIGAILEKDFPYARRPRLRYYDTTSTPSTRRPHADPKDALHLKRRRHVVGQGPVRGGSRGHDCLVLWLEAPSLETLEARLRGRGAETEEKIQKDHCVR